MATWAEISVDAFAAAKMLRDKHLRSCISRSFYAAYAAAVGELRRVKGMKFSFNDNNPSPKKIHELIRNHLDKTRFNRADIAIVSQALYRLYIWRVTADYAPASSVSPKDAVDCVRDAYLVLRRLGVFHD